MGIMQTGVSGSPPLVRERLNRGFTCVLSSGITPARAGKTSTTASCHFAGWDHPRSCGKDLYPALFAAAVLGSPPLVRERQVPKNNREPNSRITPARAGKTRAFGSMPYLRWDHPRSCGKDFYQVHRRLGEWGSPPLVRERHLMGLVLVC